MRVNFLEGFSRWLEEETLSPPENEEENGKGQDFDTWLQQNMNFGLKDLAQLGDLQLANTNFKTIGGEDIPVVGMVKFRVKPLDDEGNAYELEDAGEGDSEDASKPAEPYGRSSPHAGKKYKVTKQEFQRLWLFPSQAQMAGGAGGLGGPPGGPPGGLGGPPGGPPPPGGM
jgi:hypothetical protein